MAPCMAFRSVLLGGALCLCSCGTVDLGDPPADVNTCRPDRMYFVQQVWPNFLNKPVEGGKKCSDARGHDATSGRQMSLTTPTSPVPAAPPLPSDWEVVYKSVTNQMACTNVAQSALLTRPDGRTTHGGGILIQQNGPEA